MKINHYKYFKILKAKINFIYLTKKISKNRKMNKKLQIIFGAGNTYQKNWISTEQENLDLLKVDTFNKLFKKNEISNILAEHVFEHLSLENGIQAIKNLKPFLKINAKIRIAVPDGYFPSKEYINYVKPGGVGPGADDHKMLYNFKTISKLFDNDFKINLLEYFDEQGNFQYKKWDINDGKVIRSRYFDPRNTDKQVNYSSLIIDAIYNG